MYCPNCGEFYEGGDYECQHCHYVFSLKKVRELEELEKEAEKYIFFKHERIVIYIVSFILPLIGLLSGLAFLLFGRNIYYKRIGISCLSLAVACIAILFYGSHIPPLQKGVSVAIAMAAITFFFKSKI